MWARGDMKIQIPQKLGLTPCFRLRAAPYAATSRLFGLLEAFCARQGGDGACERAMPKRA